MSKLVFQNSPSVVLATNTFVNVPILLKYEETNLIQIVQNERLEYTTSIPIYHPDGTFLAVATGNRIFKTEAGAKANVEIEKHSDVWECKLENRTLFEIRIQKGEMFKTTAELYTPEGYFVKIHDDPKAEIINMQTGQLKVGGLTMMDMTIQNFTIGVWLKDEGKTVLVGVN